MKILYLISLILITKTLFYDLKREHETSEQDGREREADGPDKETDKWYVNDEGKEEPVNTETASTVNRENYQHDFNGRSDKQEAADERGTGCKDGNLTPFNNSSEINDNRSFDSKSLSNDYFQTRIPKHLTQKHALTPRKETEISTFMQSFAVKYPITENFPNDEKVASSQNSKTLKQKRMPDSLAAMSNLFVQKEKSSQMFDTFFTDMFQSLKDIRQICVVSESVSLFDSSIDYGNKQRIQILRQSLDSVTQTQLPSNCPIILIIKSPSRVNDALLVLKKQFPANFVLIFSIEPMSKNQIPDGIVQWFDIYLFVSTYIRGDISDPALLVYEICAYCDNGDHKIAIVNGWNRRNGFTKIFSLKKSFKGNFFGATLRYETAPAMIVPLITYKKMADGKEEFGGTSTRLLNTASKFFNLSYATKFNRHSGSLVNDTWTGALGSLHSNKVDFLPPFALYYDRSQDFAFTHVLSVEVLVIVSLKPSLLPPWKQIVSPFSPLVWLCVFVAIAATSLIRHTIQIVYSTLRQAKQNPRSSENLSFLDNFFIVWTVICWKNCYCLHPRKSMFILMGSWMLASFIIVSCYQATLVSHLLTPVYANKPIDTLEHLIDNQIEWSAAPGSNVDALLEGYETLTELKTSTPPAHKSTQAIQELDDSKAIVMSRSRAIANSIRFDEHSGQSKLHISSSSYYLLLEVWFFRKDAPYADAMNSFCSRIFEAGIFNKFASDEMAKVRLETFLKSMNRTTEEEGAFISLDHFLSAIIVFVFGIAVSLLVFAGEILVAKRQRNQNRDNAVN